MHDGTQLHHRAARELLALFNPLELGRIALGAPDLGTSMNSDPVLAGFDKFMSAVRGIEPQHIAQALNTFTPGTDWRKCSKYRMAECYGLAVADKSPGVFDQAVAALRQLDLDALTTRARACASGGAGWNGLDAAAGLTPPPAAAEIAAEVFKAPVLASMRQELHAVLRSLLRMEDKLRAAQQRGVALQEHNAALLALEEQAAVPGGVEEHEFSRPGGWRDRALRLACLAEEVTIRRRTTVQRLPSAV